MRKLACSLILGLAVPHAGLAGEDPTTTYTPEKPLLAAPDLGDFTPASEDPFIPQTVRKHVLPDESASLPPYLPEAATSESQNAGTIVAPSPGAPPVVTAPPVVVPPVPLYPNVRVRNAACVAPNAVPTVIPVPDPRDRCGVVYIEVCLPPCRYEISRINLRGNRARLEVGGYSVSIISRRGVIILDYHS